MKKIAIVTPFGAEERLDQFAEFIVAQGLVKRGCDVRYFTYRIKSNPAYVKDECYKGVNTIRCSQKLGIAPRLVWNIFVWRPEVVILNHTRSYLNLCGYFAAKLVGAKTVFQVVGFLHDDYVVEDRDDPLDHIRNEIHLIHGFWDFLKTWMKTRSFKSNWENFLFHMPLYRSDKRVTITQFERAALQRIAGLDSEIIPWGVHLDMEKVGESLPVMKDGRPLPENYLFYIGQVKRRKGWDTIIQALDVLKREGVKRNLVFVTSSSPAEFKEAEDMVKSFGLEDQVYFMFRISNPEREWLYNRATATLAPSRYEGFGLTVFESWVAKVPVLGTDIPVYSDFMFDGDTALVSKKGDPESMAVNIKRLDEPGMRERLVQGGLRMVKEFSAERVVDGFWKLLEEFPRK
ncbi:MAG: glycosyltransferase family 4 protein [Patescibacteria group bacterium]